MTVNQAAAATEEALDYPAKPIRIVVPFAPGGLIDRMGRLAAAALEARWQRPVVIDNRPGAGGGTGAAMVYRATPDGHTLLVGGPGPLVINRYLYDLPYDPARFVPVSLIQTNSGVLLVRPDSGITTLQELVERVQREPDRHAYVSGGTGSISHITMEMLKLATGMRLRHRPTSGNIPALAMVLDGSALTMYVEFSAGVPRILNGSLRALGIGAPERSTSLPNVPSIQELLPGFASRAWAALVAPPGTPSAIAEQLSAAIRVHLERPDVARTLSEAALDPVGSSPAALKLWMEQESTRWENVVRQTSMQADPIEMY